jgi:A/G-specific adenine glycosylase
MARVALFDQCPVAAHCRARALGVQLQRPVAEERRDRTIEQEHVIAVAEQAGRVLIVRRKPDGLLGGLWELPGGEVEPHQDRAQALARHLQAGLRLDAQVAERLAVIKHAYSRFRVTVYVYRCHTSGTPVPANGWDACHWLAADEVDAYGLTGVATRALARVPWAGSGLLL